jgi:3,4-dihydroxy 2-butanone 4-phosphate synthase/GTP cyclohydrolase II
VAFAPIQDAIEDIRAGRMVVVVDDEDRENEGDLTIAAEKVTSETINFMATHGRGLICMPLTGQRLDELRIPLMVQDTENSAKFGTAFCVPVEAKRGTTTGISASDRATTVLAAVDPNTKPEDLARPGHMFPLRAQEGWCARVRRKPRSTSRGWRGCSPRGSSAKSWRRMEPWRGSRSSRSSAINTASA